MVLKRDEEEILKVLLKLYKEQKKLKISGSFTDFPVKYQIIYKEILLRLQENKFIKDFEDVISEDFILTLLPPALKYFTAKSKIENTNVSTGLKEISSVSSSANKVLDELDLLIAKKGSKDEKELKEIAAEIREFCDNLKNAPTVQPRKILMKKVKDLSSKYPWLLEEITKALGLTMINIMAGV